MGSISNNRAVRRGCSFMKPCLIKKSVVEVVTQFARRCIFSGLNFLLLNKLDHQA
jgi:hypothetical protein